MMPGGGAFGLGRALLGERERLAGTGAGAGAGAEAPDTMSHDVEEDAAEVAGPEATGKGERDRPLVVVFSNTAPVGVI